MNLPATTPRPHRRMSSRPLKEVPIMQKARIDWVQFILNRFIWFIIVGVFIFFSFRAEGFLTGLNMVNLLMHASVLGLMVIGQAICLMSGNFDLSAEGTVS